jgi:hypothetical protein
MGQSVAGSETPASDSRSLTSLDARAPRFGQTVTMSVLLLAIGLQEPLLILALAVVLNAAVLSGWRVNLYGFVWRHVMLPLVGPPEETEPAPPHRFAKLLGAVMSATATVLLFGAPAVDLPVLALVGYGVALMHAGAAAVGGIGDYCIGCRLYKQVSYFRRLGVV